MAPPQRAPEPWSRSAVPLRPPQHWRVCAVCSAERETDGVNVDIHSAWICAACMTRLYHPTLLRLADHQ